MRGGHLLNRAIRELSNLRLSTEDFYRTARLTDGLVGLRNALQTAWMIARAAHHNRTSRGCHYRDDARASQGGTPPLS